MAVTLQSLIDDAKARAAADQAKIQAGTDAIADLATAQSLIDRLTEAKSLCDGVTKSAGDRLTAAQAAGTALSGGGEYGKAGTDLAALLKKISPDGKLDDAAMKAELAKVKLPDDTWPNLATAAAGAAAKAAKSQLAADEALVALDAARRKLDLRVAALLARTGGAEALGQQAATFFGEAQRRIAAGDAAAAWFALARAAASLDALSKVDLTADLASAKSACDDYTNAADAAIKADVQLAKDSADRAKADAALATAAPLAEKALAVRTTKPTP